MFECAKKDKFLLRSLKTIAVKAQQFELAAQIRAEEAKLFPLTVEETIANNVSNVLSMVGIDANQATSWKIWKVITAYSEKGNSLSIQDTSEIKSQSVKLFGE